MRTRYVCVSESCRHEVETDIPVARTNGAFLKQTCSECGSEMKKVYSAPAFTRVSKAEAIERFDDVRELMTQLKRKAAG